MPHGPNTIKQAPGWLCALHLLCDPLDPKTSSEPTLSQDSEPPSAPVPTATTHAPSSTTTQSTSSQETESSTTTNPEASEKSTLGLVSTSNLTHSIRTFATQSTKSSISTSSSSNPPSANSTQVPVVPANHSLSSNIAQLRTTGLIPPSIAAESTSSHTGADPRIIVPVVLIVVALAVGCVIIWLKKIKGRRTSPGEETLKSIETQIEGVGSVTQIHIEARSSEKSGRVMGDTENPPEPGSMGDNARVHIGRDEDDRDCQVEVLSRRGGGYGWGLGKQDDKLSGLAEQEDIHEPAPAYSRDPY